MLKKVLEEKLKEADLKIAELRIDNTKLTAQLHSSTKEIERLNEQSLNHQKQMTQINQSIYTILRVKYPVNHDSMPHAIHTCKSATEVMDTMSVDTEEKLFLLYLLELSNEQNTFDPGRIFPRF